jgi:hypothetical protein
MVRTDENATRTMMVHVRFEGRSFDVPTQDLALAPGASDGALKEALARYLDLSVRDFDSYVVERHETGNWTVRPEAVFG